MREEASGGLVRDGHGDHRGHANFFPAPLSRQYVGKHGAPIVAKQVHVARKWVPAFFLPDSPFLQPPPLLSLLPFPTLCFPSAQRTGQGRRLRPGYHIF